MSVLTRHRVGVAYHRHRESMLDVVRRFRKRYGGDGEELESEALVHFVNAYLSWDPSRGDFGKRMRYYVWTRLFNSYQAEVGRNNRMPRVNLPVERRPARERPPFDREGLECSLSQDAREAVALLLDELPPLTKYLKPNEARRWLVSALKEAGWAAARIAESFQEITESL